MLGVGAVDSMISRLGVLVGQKGASAGVLENLA
jgi:hypothetical protein